MQVELLAKRLNAKAQHVGNGEWKTSCPVKENHKHGDRNPSLTIKMKDGKLLWRCHKGCSQQEVFAALQERDLIPKIEKRVKATPPKPITADGREYFYRRELSDKTIDDLKLSADSKSVHYPYYIDGELVTVKTKFLNGSGYTQTKGGGSYLYNLDNIDWNQPVVITEGEMDTASLYEVGIQAVSVPNGASLSGDPLQRPYIKNSIELFDTVPQIIIATDNDEPGIALREKLADAYGRDRCAYVEWPIGCKDANDVLVNFDSDVLEKCISNAKQWPIKQLQRAADSLDAVKKLYRDGRARGMSTGYKSVDEYYTVQLGELEIVTGHPGTGKSNWLDQVNVNLSKQFGTRHAVCSFENPADQHLAILAEKYVEKSFVGHNGIRLAEDELEEAVDWIDKHFFFLRLEDDDHPTVDTILRLARAVVMRFGIQTLTIDPWNYIEQSRDRGQNETEYVSAVLGKLRNFAQRLGVHVYLVAHPAKMMKDKDGSIPAPTGMDISGSNNFWTKADVLTVIHRHPTVNPHAVEVIFRKVRVKTTGTPGAVDLNYELSSGCYRQPDVV